MPVARGQHDGGNLVDFADVCEHRLGFDMHLLLDVLTVFIVGFEQLGQCRAFVRIRRKQKL